MVFFPYSIYVTLRASYLITPPFLPSFTSSVVSSQISDASDTRHSYRVSKVSYLHVDERGTPPDPRLKPRSSHGAVRSRADADEGYMAGEGRGCIGILPWVRPRRESRRLLTNLTVSGWAQFRLSHGSVEPLEVSCSVIVAEVGKALALNTACISDWPNSSRFTAQCQMPFVCFVNLRLKPRYLSYLIDHEGTGSLLSILKPTGWVNNVGAGLIESYVDWAMFGIGITCTDEGLVSTSCSSLRDVRG